MRRVLRALYDELFDDAMVGFLFVGKDKARIVEHQLWFTARFLGGPQDRYEGRPLPEAHAPLPLLPGHFDRRHHVLKQVLERERVPANVIEAWLRVDQNLRASVLKSGADARARARRED